MIERGRDAGEMCHPHATRHFCHAAPVISAGAGWRPALAGFALVGLLVASAQAADYYVKNGGNDALDGQSLATAWATLGRAATTVAPGDTVRVQNGTYTGFDLRRGGAPGLPITFVADGTGVQITADGPTTDGINVEGADYVILDGFVVNNRTRNGIRVVESDFVTVRNCRTGYNGERGIFTGFADDVTIAFNETHHSIDEHGIYVSNSGDRPVIRGNVSYANRAAGIHMNGDASLGGDGLISNALVEDNLVYGNGVGGGSGINMDGVTNSVIRNNLLYDNHASGISLYRIDGATGSTGNTVVNNTVINAADGRWCLNINTGSTGNTVVNNILYNYHSFRGVISIDASSRPGFVSDYNSLMDRFSLDGGGSVGGLATWRGAGYDAHSFLATPADHFVTPGADFHLLATSPAIDAGTPANAPPRDRDGNPRPVGAGYDLGAYERQLAECGDGGTDPGEQCGEPALAGCGDPCTSCTQCVCAPLEAQCGDGAVCGSEQCETDADCAGGEVCDACRCINPPVCTSGIVPTYPRLRMEADPFFLRLRGRAVMPKPWTAIDPAANGIRVVVDAERGPGGIDVTIPGGPQWLVNATGTRWEYLDELGTIGGITRVVVRDRSSVVDGLARWRIVARVGATVLPDVNVVRASVVLGAPHECAAVTFNPPAGARPRCLGDSTVLRCR
jgi:hypothetical protein